MKNTAHRLKGSSTSSCYKQNENNEIVKKKVAAYVLESTETAEKVIFLGVVSPYHQLKKIRTVFSELFQKIITTK